MRHRPHTMALAFRTFALALAAAHVWVAAMPCAPAVEARLPAPRPEAAAASDHEDLAPTHHEDASPARHDGAATASAPCPGHAVAAPAPARPALSLLPVCPCGCSDRTPTAGASSVRLGVALLPSAGPGRPAPPHVEHAVQGNPAPPDVTLPGPDVVPRPASIA